MKRTCQRLDVPELRSCVGSAEGTSLCLRGAAFAVAGIALLVTVTSLMLVATVLVPGRASAGEVKVLAAGGSPIYVKKHAGHLWSMYIDNVVATDVFSLLEEVDGPTYSTIPPLTRPVRMSVHRVPFEKVLARMLIGYNFVMTYEGERVSHVRILNSKPGFTYQMPRAVETRPEWYEKEKDAEQQGATAPGKAAAAP